MLLSTSIGMTEAHTSSYLESSTLFRLGTMMAMMIGGRVNDGMRRLASRQLRFSSILATSNYFQTTRKSITLATERNGKVATTLTVQQFGQNESFIMSSRQTLSSTTFDPISFVKSEISSNKVRQYYLKRFSLALVCFCILLHRKL